MKLYDFSCKSCGNRFEDLVSDPSEARCPACSSASVERELSRFSVGGRSGADVGGYEPTGGCGSGACGGGMCGLS